MLSTLPERRACCLMALLLVPVVALGETQDSGNVPPVVDGAAPVSSQPNVTPIPVGRIVPAGAATAGSAGPAGQSVVPQPALDTARLQPLAQAYSDPLSPLYGYGQPGYSQPMDPLYGQMQDPAYGQGTGFGFGAMDPGYGQLMDPLYGQYPDPGYAQSFDYGYAPRGAGSYDQGQYPYAENTGGYPPRYPSVGVPQTYGSSQMSGYNSMDSYHLQMLERLDAMVNRLERIEQLLRESHRQ